MKKLPNPEDIINAKLWSPPNNGEYYIEIGEVVAEKELFVDCMKEYGRLVRDTTLELAAEEARVTYGESPALIDVRIKVNKDSILNLKNHEDLKI